MKNLKSALFGTDNRIGRRLIVLIIAFSSLITLVISAVQLLIEYRELRSGMERQLESVGIYVPSIAGSVWDFDDKQIQLALDALVRLPGIEQAGIATPDQGKQWKAGRNASPNVVTRAYPLRHPVKGRETEIGTLEVVASLDAIYRQVASRALTIVLSNGLKTFLVAIFMVFLFRRLVTSRLEALARKVSGLATAALPPGLAAEAGPQPMPGHLDELDAVAWGLDNTAKELGLAIAALRKLNSELDARVGERTQALERANRELEAFSYSTSHDLRAPLRAVDGYAKLLEADYGQSLDDEGRHYLDRIRKAAQRMDLLIENLLQLARISRAELAKGRVELSGLVGEIAAELAAARPDRKVKVHVEKGVVGEGDAVLVRIALQNLLENAWKYSSRRDEAEIAFGVLRLPGGETAFFVRDNGIGFDMAHAQRLFQPFVRMHSGEEYSGAGIGLATVERIVSRHGGRVWAESEAGKGATFYFTLG